MKRRWLWIAAPIVAGHGACIAVPLAAMALGAPVLMPICGEAGPLQRLDQMRQWLAWNARSALLARSSASSSSP